MRTSAASSHAHASPSRLAAAPSRFRFTVIVQYARYTKDKKYDAGKGQKIGVDNAFCRNQPDNKCPAWMNQ